MRTKTVNLPHRKVSYLTADVAEDIKEKVSEKQYELLKHNVFNLEEGDIVVDKYSGCGAGWCEIDTEGNIVDLQYFSLENSLVASTGENFVDKFISRDDIHRKILLHTGQKEQNMLSFNFTKEDLYPEFIEGGNIRVIVNFSNYSLHRF